MSFLPEPSTILIPWTGITQSGTTYYVRLGTPEVLSGTLDTWEVIPAADPNTASDRIRSNSRTCRKWEAQACLQSGPEPTNRRAFFSAFYQPDGGPVDGVAGCASGLMGNNDRANANLFFGGLERNTEFFLQLSWNGVATLTLNSGEVMLTSA